MSTKNLLAPAFRHVLSQWADPATLFAFDFDGTLAPIVDEPARACMSVEGWKALRLLGQRASVAVISGRSRDNLTRLVPHEVAYLVGNHGSEGLPLGDPDFAEKSLICAQWYDRLIHNHRLKAATDDALIENKGLSLALHYRHSSHFARARSQLLARAAELRPAPRMVRGCFVINLLPEPALTKREALMALMQHSGARRVIFLGDDFTDELAFAGAPDNWLTVRVGDCVNTEAQYRLSDVRQVQDLIEILVQMLQLRLSGTAAPMQSEARTG